MQREELLKQKAEAELSVKAYQPFADQVEKLFEAKKYMSKAYDSLDENAVKTQVETCVKLIQSQIETLEADHKADKDAYISALSVINSIESDLKFEDLRIDTHVKNVYYAIRERLVNDHKSWSVISKDDIPSYLKDDSKAKLSLINDDYTKNLFEVYRVKKDAEGEVIGCIHVAVGYDKTMMVGIMTLDRPKQSSGALYQYFIKNESTISLLIKEIVVRGAKKGIKPFTRTMFTFDPENKKDTVFLDSIHDQLVRI